MDLPSTHFLSQPRPTPQLIPQPNITPNIVDTTTLAAHDFDVDTKTGFMPRTPPLARLEEEWEGWEGLFDHARFGEDKEGPLELGEKQGLSEDEKRRSERWRAAVRDVRLPFLPIVTSANSFVVPHTRSDPSRIQRTPPPPSASRPSLVDAFLHPHTPPGPTSSHTQIHISPSPRRLLGSPNPTRPNLL